MRRLIVFCVAASVGAATATAHPVETSCRAILENYRVIGRSNENLPKLFSYSPDFSGTSTANAALLPPFKIDNVNNSEGEIQCRRDGRLETLQLSYTFGAGDFSVERATVVMRAIIGALSRNDISWADQQFERMSQQAFAHLRASRVRGDDEEQVGRADLDFTDHFYARLVITPTSVTLSASSY